MNMFNDRLLQICLEKNNRLCLGLDLDNRKLKIDTLSYFEGFIKEIIDTTIDLCPVYKINFAFYERLGEKGFHILNEITKHINGRAITIADAKRGDIGNSSKYYAEAIFDTLNYDSITISPYMGEDSIRPFCEYDKGIFILCLTSNIGSENFQNKNINGKKLYLHVAELACNINSQNNNIGLVVGATKNNQMKSIRQSSKGLPWLIPGVGFQGGSLEDSIKIGSEYNSTPIINVSRGIIYAGNGSLDDIRLATENYTKKIRDVL